MYKRDIYLSKIEKGFAQVPIVVLIGARQVGKTSLMNMFIDGKNALSLIGQDMEVAGLFQKLSNIEKYLETYLNEDLNGYLLIDEFQYINNISTTLKLLTDKHNKLKILCSGSSSLDILQNVEESLAGRVRVIEVLSLSFSEYLLFNDEKIYNLYEKIDADTENSALTNPIEQLFYEYLTYGGLPRAALDKNNENKIEVLDDIYQTYLIKDVRNYIKNENIVGFNKLLRLLAIQTGNLVNVNNLSKECGLTYKTVEEYISILEQMYIIKLIEPYSSNKRNTIGKMKKIYFCDLGLRNMIEKNFGDIHFRVDKGAVFENYILLELWRGKGTGGEVQFYRTYDGTEVDFVVRKIQETLAIECKFNVFEKPVYLKGFNQFCDDENISSRFVVNKNLNINFNNNKYIQGFLVSKLLKFY
ncbi:MAG: ATP-binding protein [Bacteroidales bacterium]|jgi:predicted AAA+ superfamily ATPase|nr:ATP-binding protein [Bacteroidales bacterium]